MTTTDLLESTAAQLEAAADFLLGLLAGATPTWHALRCQVDDLEDARNALYAALDASEQQARFGFQDAA